VKKKLGKAAGVVSAVAAEPVRSGRAGKIKTPLSLDKSRPEGFNDAQREALPPDATHCCDES
jgi:hypothetical protein